MDTGKPRRRLSITLRAFLMVVLVVGLVLGWKVNRARRQRIAVDAIRAEFGSVSYDWELSPAPRTGPKVPAWLRRLAGDDMFQRADFMWANGGGATPHLKDLPGLRRLVIHGPLTDRQLEDIGKVSSLQSLELWDSDMTDSGLANLAGLRRLTELSFTDDRILPPDRPCNISDRGLLARLEDFPQLKHLFIEDCRGVTQDGVWKLKAARPDLVIHHW
jgi:hypothetical protein